MTATLRNEPALQYADTPSNTRAAGQPVVRHHANGTAYLDYGAAAAPADPHRPDADHDEVIAYVWSHPGVTFDAAVAAVRGGADEDAPVAYASDEMLDPHQKAPDHDSVIQYIWDHPGTTADTARAAVRRRRR